MTTTLHSINDGPVYTVSQLMADPKQITQPIMKFVEEWDLAKFLFRDGGANQGSVTFERDAAPLTEDGLETLAEFEEVPTTRMVGGQVVTELSETEGRALSISDDMRDFNKVGQVKKGIEQLKNAAVYNAAKKLRTLALAADIPEIPASAAWGDSGSAVIHDVFSAVESITGAEVPGHEDVEWDYEAEVMVAPRSIQGALLQDEQVRSLYVGNIADQNPAYKGFQNFSFAGLRVVFPKFWFSDRILITKPGALGFYSDARKLHMEGPIDMRPTRETRYQLIRSRALGLDQTQAGAWITGIKD